MVEIIKDNGAEISKPPEQVMPWEISIKEGVLTCIVDLKVKDGITIACGVADRIKSMVLSLEAKAEMRKEMEAAQKRVINPSVAYPGRRSH